jgi:hypothetical protein
MYLQTDDIIIFITLILIYIFGAYLFSKKNYEAYVSFPKEPDYAVRSVWDLNWVGPAHKDCYKLKDRDCMKYSNCGLCVLNGQMQCVPGDKHGPTFKEGCEQWIHTDYHDRHIFDEKVTTVSPSFDYKYPDYEAWWPSPKSRATL